MVHRSDGPNRTRDEQSTEGRGPEAEARPQFTVFAFLLALAVLFHQASLADWASLWPDAVVSLSAIAVLVRPSSVARLLAMLGVDMVAVALDLPAVSNHSLLLALTALGVFVALGVDAITRQPRLWDRGALYRRIAPVLRIEVVAVYFLAGLSKLNDSFFDPVLSCAVAMTQEVLARAPGALYTDWQAEPAIWGSVAIELLLPVLLVVRRTRIGAVFVGVGFHTVLALAGHVPFSGFAMAFYWLFVPDDIPDRLRRLRDERPLLASSTEAIGRLGASPAAFPMAGGLWLAVSAAVAWGPERAPSAIDAATNATFLVYAGVLALALVLCLRRGGLSGFRPGAFRPVRPVWLLAPALVVLNGVAPYLGLKTQSTFTMYSNLQTEEGRWNHKLVPEEVRLFRFQGRPVRVLASSDPVLAAAARREANLAWLAFRDRTSSRPNAAVTYERDGSRIVVDRVAEDPILSRPPPFPAAALLAFRDIPLSERNDCRSRRPYDPGQGS